MLDARASEALIACAIASPDCAMTSLTACPHYYCGVHDTEETHHHHHRQAQP
jgi:hypothetical protein